MTVWYDFTTTLRNRGRNGIANVEWSIGSALLASDLPVRCFALDRIGLCELDPDADLRAAVYASDSASSAGSSSAVLTWRDSVRGMLLATEAPIAVPAIHALSAVYQAPKRVRQRIGRQLETQRQAGRGATTATRLTNVVGAGDVVVSMGADWDGTLARELAHLRRRTGCRVVTMVYDLIPLTHPHLSFHNEPKLFDSYYRALLGTSDLITCISHRSRADLLAFAAERGLAAPHCHVLRLGEHTPAVRIAETAEDYFLWVGTIERRKNLDLLYDALRVIESDGGEPPRVVVAGARGWGVNDLLDELALQSTAASRAMWLIGSVDQRTLDSLYRRARALLFPSHYEGWGLPVREAAVRGLPVAAGDSPAVSEAASGYAGARLLPTDDPGPWAEYLQSAPARVAPAPIRPWSDVADDLKGHVHAL